VRRWHANNGRAIATITKAVENGDAVWPYPQVAGPAPQGDFVPPKDRPRCRPLVVTKSPLSFSATPRRSPVQQKGVDAGLAAIASRPVRPQIMRVNCRPRH